MDNPSQVTAAAHAQAKTPAPRWWVIALLVALAAAFVATRVGDIATRPLWADECGQAWIATASSLGEMYTRLLKWDSQPPLFSFGLYIVARLGDSPILLRSLSLVSGLASLALGYATARQWLGRFGSTAFALLWGASPAIAFYSREARPYALTLLVLLTFLYALGRHMTRPSLLTTLALVLTTVMGALTVYASIVVIGACLGAALVAEGRPFSKGQKAAGLWGSVFALGLCGVILLKTLVLKYEISVHAKSGFHLRLPDGASWMDVILYSLKYTVQLFGYVTLGEIYGARWSILLAVSGCVLVGLVIFAAFNRFKNEPRIRILFIALAGLVVSLLVLFILRLHPYGPVRHCLIVAPLVLLCSAAAIEWIHHRWPAVAVSLVAMLVLVGLASSYRVITPNYYVQDLPGALKEAAPHMGQNDVLLIPENSALSFAYYRTRLNLPSQQVVHPEFTPSVDSNREQLLQSIPAGSRCWLVLTHYSEPQRQFAEQSLSPNWVKDQTIIRCGAEVSSWIPASPTTPPAQKSQDSAPTSGANSTMSPVSTRP